MQVFTAPPPDRAARSRGPVERGYRGDEEYRNSFARLLAHDAERAGRPPLPAPGLPAWVGVGPLLWHSCTGGDMVVVRHWLGP
ncbi:hypothetical protein [Streptomyces sp. B29(2018)]|uniref:hypothetical protein n=1 Tax=Streptomyces sp. B29(2018) TaxID=2485016 RepID=UPI001F0B8B0F|nr:hypothetical protein [Streptomyces sp. B29(2018)]